MQSQTQPARLVLGDFEFDAKAGELRPIIRSSISGSGRTVLARQPFQILLMLIEGNGQIVTREQIRRTLWPPDITVEFDHSINAAVRKLRQALDESAKAPRLIETIGRRGYRLTVNTDRRYEAPETLPLTPDVPKPLSKGRRFVSKCRDLPIRSGHVPGPRTNLIMRRNKNETKVLLHSWTHDELGLPARLDAEIAGK